MTDKSSAGFFAENKENMAKIKREGNQIVTNAKRNIVFVVGIVVAIVFVIVFALEIIAGMFALLVTAVVLGLMFYIGRLMIASDSMIKQKTNLKLMKMRIELAKNNQIEQLQLMVVHKEEELERSRASRTKIGGQLGKLKSDVDQTEEGSSEHEVGMNIYNNINKAHKNSEKICEMRRVNLVAFKKEVESAKTKKKFTDMAMEILNGIEGFDKAVEEMLTLEAFESVDEGYYETMQELEDTLSDEAIDS